MLIINLHYKSHTWTPKKGKVAEPGFWGQAPGNGVICDAIWCTWEKESMQEVLREIKRE